MNRAADNQKLWMMQLTTVQPFPAIDNVFFWLEIVFSMMKFVSSCVHQKFPSLTAAEFDICLQCM